MGGWVWVNGWVGGWVNGKWGELVGGWVWMGE